MILRGSLCRATRLVAVAVRVLVGYIGKCVLEERTVNLKRRRCFSGRITCETSWKCSVSGIRVANQTWNCDYEHFYMSKSKWTLVCFVLFYGCRWSVLSNVIPQGVSAAPSSLTSGGRPRDISVIRASPVSFVVTWSDNTETSQAVRYQVAYRPVNDRYDIIQEAEGDKRAIILDNLRPGTRYRVHVTAVTSQGRSNHSDVVLFDTDHPRNESNDRTLLVGTMSVRAEEIGIVVVVLALWIFVIVLFFNKWGKIRMLEPYQPQYKHPRTPSCPHVHNTRLSLQLATFSSAEREHLLYSGPSCIHKSTRVRQNSVFVGNPYARHSLAQVTPSRKVKSAEDINSMIFNAQPNAASTSRVTMQTTNV